MSKWSDWNVQNTWFFPHYNYNSLKILTVLRQHNHCGCIIMYHVQHCDFLLNYQACITMLIMMTCKSFYTLPAVNYKMPYCFVVDWCMWLIGSPQSSASLREMEVSVDLSGAGLEGLALLADLFTLPPITIAFHPRLGDGTQSTWLHDVLDALLD